jgi:hypothetical protein
VIGFVKEAHETCRAVRVQVGLDQLQEALRSEHCPLRAQQLDVDAGLACLRLEPE